MYTHNYLFINFHLFLYVALLVKFFELIPRSLTSFDGENSEFTCNLLGGINNISIISEWSITLQNGTTIEISDNSSEDFILLPPHNSKLVIVRHDINIFDQATITCNGGRNFTGLNAQLSIDRECIIVMVIVTNKLIIATAMYDHEV